MMALITPLRRHVYVYASKMVIARDLQQSAPESLFNIQELHTANAKSMFHAKWLFFQILSQLFHNKVKVVLFIATLSAT